MVRDPSPAETEAFVRNLKPAQLVDLLLELGADHEAVRKRLLRLMLADNPKRLAAGFRKTLTAWQRADTFYGYREVQAFGKELQEWLVQMERELLPRDPAAALDLAEAFIHSDAELFGRADNSGGVTGDAFRAGCRLWLKAAAACESPAVGFGAAPLWMCEDEVERLLREPTARTSQSTGYSSGAARSTRRRTAARRSTLSLWGKLWGVRARLTTTFIRDKHLASNSTFRCRTSSDPPAVATAAPSTAD